MRARRVVLALVVACARGASAMTVDELPSDRGLRVERVAVEGLRDLPRSAILRAMVTRRPPWYELWRRWTERTDFSASLFRADLVRVGRVLRERGYYRAEVRHTLALDGERVSIVLHVREGPVTTVADVGLVAADFALAAGEEETARAELALAPGDVFTQEGYHESRARLATRYQTRGFAYVDVVKAAVVDTETHRARVRYTITRGRPAVFGATEVRGTDRVAERLVLRELAYAPGDPYDPRQMILTQARVFGLHLFRSVVVAPANLAEASGVVDVRIEVVEGPPREVKAGIGYGDEEGVRGQVRWQHNDWLGGGRQLGFRLKGSELTQEATAELRQPYFLDRRQTLVVPLRQARDDEPGFTATVVSLAPRIERRLAPSLTAALGWIVEYDDVTDIPDATVARLDELRARGLVSGPTLWVERNTTTDLLDPRAGSIVRLTLAQAGGPWQGDYAFARGLLDARGYLPLSRRLTVAGRARLGLADAFDGSRDVPVFRRFYAGGIDSTRGYGRHLVGPLNAFQAPVGGRSLLEGSLELRADVREPFGAVVFLDVGEVRRQAFRFGVDDLQWGVGVGVRYQTLVGPLRLDLGVPLDPPPGEPSWRVHFSIGQAF